MEALEGGQVAEEPCHIAEQIPQDHSAEMSAEDAEAVDAVLGNVDILKLLFNQLDLADLCRLSGVCKLWRAVTSADEFWRDVSFEGRHLSTYQVRGVLFRHPNIVHLNMKGVQVCGQRLRPMLQHLTQLQSLKLGGREISEGNLALTLGALPHLTHLTLETALMTGGGPTHAGPPVGLAGVMADVDFDAFPAHLAPVYNNPHQAQHGNIGNWVLHNSLDEARSGDGAVTHDHLASLDVVDCHVARLTLACARLSRLSIRGSSVLQLVLRLPALRDLSLIRASKLSDMGLRACLLRLQSLTALDISGSTVVTDDTLREISTSLARLQSLTARGCSGVVLNGVRGFHSLRSLDLAGCDAVTPTATVSAINSYTALESLCLDQCTLLTTLHLLLPRLQRASFRGCPALAAVDLRCPHLSEARFGSGTDAFSNALYPLKRLTLASTALTSAQWRGFAQLESLALACPGLTRLDLSYCAALQDDVWGMLGWEGPPLPAFSQSVSHAAGPPCGCPSLRTLTLDGCEGLSKGTLRSRSLSSLAVSSCPRLRSLNLCAPSLTHLQLDECDALAAVTLAPVGLRGLMLGSCPHLATLSLQAPLLRTLDLKGCGLLSTISAQCPALDSIDATFCGQLDGGGLERLVRAAPMLQTLLLSVCESVAPSALACLVHACHLRILDLSYTEIHDLEPVLAACPQLHTLRLSSCRCLRSDALRALFPAPSPAQPQALPSQQHADVTHHLGPEHQQCKVEQQGAMVSQPAVGLPGLKVLPMLTELDVSYCPLSTEELSDLLEQATGLQTLAINGCDGATDAIWECVNGVTGEPGRQHSLHTLSCVGCKHLRCCWLGLLPATPADTEAQAKLMSAGMYAPALPTSTAWVPAGTSLAGLKTLRLGLSGVRSLALALPHLQVLDVNGASKLRCLELRCPTLLTAFFQACRSLPGDTLEGTLRTCSALETVDMQHSQAGTDTATRLRVDCPGIRVLLVSRPAVTSPAASPQSQ